MDISAQRQGVCRILVRCMIEQLSRMVLKIISATCSLKSRHDLKQKHRRLKNRVTNSQTLLPRWGCERQLHVITRLITARHKDSSSTLAQSLPDKDCSSTFRRKKHKEMGNVEDKSNGWPRTLDPGDERHIKLITLQNVTISSCAIGSRLTETSGTLVHPSTVWRSLAGSGLYLRGAARNWYVFCFFHLDKTKLASTWAVIPQNTFLIMNLLYITDH